MRSILESSVTRFLFLFFSLLAIGNDSASVIIHHPFDHHHPSDHLMAYAESLIPHGQFDYSNSAIIKPNQEGFDRGREIIKKYHPIVIDSRDRDVIRHPDPSKYVIDLDDEIQDVIAAELVTANIPIKSYIVNKTNNSFQLTLNDSTLITLSVPNGDYTPLQLISQLEKSFQDQGIQNQSIDFRYDEIQDKFMFESSLPFMFHFEKQTAKASPFNMGKLLGFNNRTFEAENTSTIYVIMPPFRKNFDETNYALLKITGFYAHKSLNQVIDKTFAIIPFDRLDQNIVSDLQPIRKDFNPPIPRLSKLQISFVDRNGDYIDFQNHDHYFIIRLESFRHTRKYASFVDM